MVKKQKILVFQQNGGGEKKIAALSEYGKDLFDISIVNIDQSLPEVLDETEDILGTSIDADLVLDFLKHPDLSYDLAVLCRDLNVPIVASSKKLEIKTAITPTTCCYLPRLDNLGHYGEHFGAPEYKTEVKDGKIENIEVVRGAPCAATWHATKKMIGMKVEDAIVRMGVESQFYCSANPAGWDPIYQKSLVHLAGEIHSKALEKSIKGE